MTYEKIFGDVKKIYSKADKSKLKESDDFAFQFNVTGEGEGIFYVAYRGGILEVAPYDYLDKNATIIGSGENIIKLATAKVTLEEALEQNLLFIDGDCELAKTLDRIAVAETAKRTAKKEVAQKPRKPASK